MNRRRRNRLPKSRPLPIRPNPPSQRSQVRGNRSLRRRATAARWTRYAGGGFDQVDLATATIGFAESEREANPFRIAETQSIRDEAEARGIDLIVTNAESDLNKEISDIQSMVDQGVDAR